MTIYLLIALSVCTLVPLGAARLNLISQKRGFFAAQHYCQQHGGHLVSIHSAAENEAVHKLCDAAHSDCWIGLTQNTKTFHWTDGSQFQYNNWHSGEPDNWNGVEHCAMMRSQYHDGTWSDQSCTQQYSHAFFVCDDAPVPPTSPTPPTPPTTPTTAYTTLGGPVPGNYDQKLQIGLDHAHFTLHGQRVFLSGINQAWVSYAYDFGASQYQYRRQQYEKTIQQMAAAGANSIRIWVHVEGETSPLFNSQGFVTGTDKDDTLVSDLQQYIRYAAQHNILVFITLWNVAGIWVHVEGETSPLFNSQGFVTGTDKDDTLVSDLQQYIRYAAQHNILVFITLWNAAVKQSFHYRIDGLIRDTAKLQSYLDHALTPLVRSLKDEPGLGGWDIINEMEGQLRTDSVSADHCFDTTFLKNSGAGWAGHLYTAQQFLRFINYQVDAIRRADPQAQVTAGAWSPDSVTDQLGWRNLYKDECLVKAGGKQMGTLTFYSMHSYDWNHQYAPAHPFLHDFADYHLDKPLVVAEFNQKRGAGRTLSEQFQWLYHHGYAGGWSWSYTDDGWSEQATGLQSIRAYTNQTDGGLVNLAGLIGN